MNANTKALAEKVARGKGLNASDRELMAQILADDTERKLYADMVLELGKKVEKLTVELIQGTGRFGLYMKVTVPGSYKSLNMGLKKFQGFMAAVESIGYDKIVKAFNDGKETGWELETVTAPSSK